ncbi:Imm26 family immunity protein [Nocardioides montaniterrae]
MSEPQTNLRVLKASRKKPEPGDIFALQPARDLFLFGQVVLADFYGPMPNTYLIYVYDHKSASSEPDLGKLVPERLLVAPLFINRIPWTKGLFENVTRRELDGHVLQHHRFRDWNGQVVDEHGEVSVARRGLVGQYALSSYRWLDDHVSDALGIRRAAEDTL